MKQFIINDDNAGQRLDKYILRLLDKSSMSFIYKMLRKKNFVLNDKKATGKEIIKCGDIVKLYLSDETYEKFKTQINIDNSQITTSKTNVTNGSSINLNISELIIYEDADIILINKPAGILSQKAEKNDISINEFVLDYLIREKKISEEQLKNYRPSVINRLDRNTTGIIIVAKRLRAAQVLSKALKDRSIKKYYKCIVYGTFNKEGIYSGYLTKDTKSNIVKISDNELNDDSSYIETEYKLIKLLENNLSEIRVHLITGKSHQIRAHLSYLGYPIIGDRKYGNKDVNKKFYANNQLLHAYKIEFPDFNNEDQFEFSGKSFECAPNFRY